MNNINIGYMLLQLLVALPFVLLLVYLSLKLGGSKLQQLQNGKFIKVLERVSVTKENSLLVTKIGQKAYVISSSNGKIEILLELSEDEIKNLENNKELPQYDSLSQFCKNILLKRKVKDDEEN
jgi:flagellar protein FliO/FliZ